MKKEISKEESRRIEFMKKKGFCYLFGDSKEYLGICNDSGAFDMKFIVIKNNGLDTTKVVVSVKTENDTIKCVKEVMVEKPTGEYSRFVGNTSISTVIKTVEISNFNCEDFKLHYFMNMWLESIGVNNRCEEYSSFGSLHFYNKDMVYPVL